MKTCMWRLFGHKIPVLCNYSNPFKDSSILSLFRTEDKLHISGYSLNVHRCRLVYLSAGCRKTSQQVMKSSQTVQQSHFYSILKTTKCFCSTFIFDLWKKKLFVLNTLANFFFLYFKVNNNKCIKKESICFTFVVLFLQSNSYHVCSQLQLIV